ncbi:MAG: hypothetical protein J0L61_02740 [Planctomycetes bacterium]|nr:hypothetical protein [Planctomycetota bacterium]
MRRTSAFIASAALAVIAGSASAVPVFDFVLTEGGSAVYSTAANPGTWSAIPQSGGAWLVQGSYASASVSLDFQLTLKEDPFATVNFNLTNTSGALGLYSTSLTLAVTPVAAPSNYQGGISGSIGDNSLTFDGALLTATPGAFYTALVDGSPLQSLYAAGSFISEPFGGLTADIPAVNYAFGSGPAVASTIGIVNTFSLTADDSVGMVSRFDIIPAPGAASLLGVAGLVATRRRR